MTLATRQVLGTLLRSPETELYGAQICRTTGLPSGTVHPILARLERHGWLESRYEQINAHLEGRAPRHFYRFTPDGAQQARKALPSTPRRRR